MGGQPPYPRVNLRDFPRELLVDSCVVIGWLKSGATLDSNCPVSRVDTASQAVLNAVLRDLENGRFTLRYSAIVEAECWPAYPNSRDRATMHGLFSTMRREPLDSDTCRRGAVFARLIRDRIRTARGEQAKKLFKYDSAMNEWLPDRKLADGLIAAAAVRVVEHEQMPVAILTADQDYGFLSEALRQKDVRLIHVCDVDF